MLFRTSCQTNTLSCTVAKLQPAPSASSCLRAGRRKKETSDSRKSPGSAGKGRPKREQDQNALQKPRAPVLRFRLRGAKNAYSAILMTPFGRRWRFAGGPPRRAERF